MAFWNKVKTFFAGKTLYFPGCVTKYKLPKIKENYATILKELGYDFVMLDNEFCCGLPALNKGYQEDFERLRHENMKLFEEHSIGKIITNCPACAHMFKEYYDMPAQHIVEIIPKQSVQEDRGEVSYHDPCHLARHCKLTKEPRELIQSLGFKIKENDNQKENTLCCGTGHIDTEKSTAKKVAELRLRDFDTKKVITTCPLCYKHLKASAEEKEVLELSEVIME